MATTGGRSAAAQRGGSQAKVMLRSLARMNLVSTQHALLPCLAPDLSHRSLRGVSMEGRSTIVSPVRCGEASLSSGK